MAFYYWKTNYKTTAVEQGYLQQLKVRNLYVRIIDVYRDAQSGAAVPVSPVTFSAALPDSINIVPVVFIVNNILRSAGKPELNSLAAKISTFVNGKVKQAGKQGYHELQIDCDWTATTRDNYFYLLKELARQPALKGIRLSATLRLHQLKNLKRNGVPPVSRVMLMCYNMGNLRKYGNQNSILDMVELKKYADQNVGSYSLPMDVGFPLFSWAVVFRDKQYAGISKRVKITNLQNKKQFIFIGKNMYRALDNLPEYGLLRNDEVRWEDAETGDLNKLAGYLSPLIKTDSLNLIYFHLDEDILKKYTPQQLRETAEILR
ncbi:hypothetical protein [Mucilaginibacter pedocola]|uniref:hypothetical protein n=1 Tax=Mucilaginibacter pedocola TaxID=1792845 RepID=UPI0011805EB8|nr:hypothetical protein [Mucilaginibacter pedocola]